jgi:oxygen-independent coproporphyrinogen III oxidase
MSGSGFAFSHLFLSVPGEGELPVVNWADALLRERRLRTDAPGLSRPLLSLFVGGDEPEVLGAHLTERVRRVTGPDALDGIGEWTVEVSDPSIPGAVISEWLLGGVTRLSLRGAAAIPASVARLSDLCAGRAALGVDLPLQSRGGDAMGRRIEELIRLGANSLAFVESDPAAVAAHGPEATGPAEPGGSPDLERNREAWLAAVDGIHRAGWRFLDLAFAFGSPTCPVHPRAIARRIPVLGLGPGAVTFRHPRRRWNPADARSYVRSMDADEDPLSGREFLTRAEGRLERCWTALRSARGLRIPTSSCAFTPWFRRWQEAGWIRSGVAPGAAAGYLRLTPEGWLVADGLAVELAMELERIPPGGSTDHPEFQNFEE